jgi:hypothetical protein
MQRLLMLIGVGVALALPGIVPMAGSHVAVAQGGDDLPRKEWRRGLAIAPVPLNLEGRNRRLVGEGSYIVNAQAECVDCHSCPTYEPGHNPFAGGDGQLNATNYLAGGVPFGPEVVSANITPDENGLPAGLTLEEFVELIRTGQDEDKPGEVLQVMPWPLFRRMTDHDLEAIYEYLSAIPHAEPGTCAGPGA